LAASALDSNLENRLMGHMVLKHSSLQASGFAGDGWLLTLVAAYISMPSKFPK
jgi:hypothetical protein